MAALKLLNMLAISSLAIFACSFAVSPVNALATSDPQLLVRNRGHDAIAKRKRNSTLEKRCKPRPPPVAATTKKKTTTTTTTTAAAAAATTTTHPTSAHYTSPTQGSGGGGGGGSGPSGGGGPPPSSGGGGGPNKVGLAWPNGDTPELQHFKTSHVTRLYTWSPFCPSQARNLGLECIPMLWGDRQIGQFQQLVKAGYARTVLGMNEPNEPGQSNMSPEHGASLWKQYIAPLKQQGYTLISPATSSNPNGLTWVKQFMTSLDSDGTAHPDKIAVHWYDVNPQAFIDYVTLWHQTFGKPIWVTEFACQNFNGGPQCTQNQVFDFMYTVTKWMNEASFVEAYFAFGVMRDMQGVNPANQLMNSAGFPTTLGNQYINP